MFGGLAFNNLGGVRSRGPPWGNWRFAQPKIIKDRKRRETSFAKKAAFLFDIDFKRYNRLLYFIDLRY
jgi:hypothetical protein